MGLYQEVFERREVKYLLNEKQFVGLMNRLRGYAVVDEYGDTDILNIYFDTPDYLLIRTSLDKPVYKEKLRLRTYGTPVDDTNSFIEIKKKFDGIVYKRRISAPYRKALNYLTNKSGLEVAYNNRQIASEIAAFRNDYTGLEPKMMVSYKRIALVGIEDPGLRITIDRNICWRTDRLDLAYGGDGRDILEKGQYLMEIKIADAMPIELSAILSDLAIFPVSLSKYGKGYMDMMKLKASKSSKIILVA